MNNFRNFFHARKEGFGINLYRNTQDRILGGVCSGIADNFEIHHNIMRVIFVALLIFTGPLAFWSYIVACFVLLPKTKTKVKPSYEYDENERCYRKKRAFRYRENTAQRIKRARGRLDDISDRVKTMESYVTSRKYDLEKEFANLEK